MARIFGISTGLICAAMALGGCQALKPAAEATTTGPSQSTSLVERDVEAPDAFQKEDRGLWDGRPSLGGVWVAHDAVSEPERVIIRNQDNGKFVIGALFRKEVSTPGPKFQVSSGAAEALGMLAGAPAKLSVTALRREEVAEAPEAPTSDVVEVGDGSGSEGGNSARPEPAPNASQPSAPAPAAPTGSSLSKPYVQLGIFSVQANASGVAARMRAAGLPVEVKSSTVSGKQYHRVLVGPAQSSAQRTQFLSKVKAQGFSDAYVTGR